MSTWPNHKGGSRKDAFLADLTLKYKDVIENKKTDACSVKSKERAWTRLTEEFDVASTSAVQRDSTSIVHVSQAVQ